jgi:hypothetical protein
VRSGLEASVGPEEVNAVQNPLILVGRKTHREERKHVSDARLANILVALGVHTRPPALVAAMKHGLLDD